MISLSEKAVVLNTLEGLTSISAAVDRHYIVNLDAKLRWKVHVKKKRDELGLKYKHMYWLMGRRSAMSTHNKLMLYKQILKPAWT